VGAQVRPATQEEIERWDELVAARGPAASVLQGSAFAEIKATTGWQPRFYMQAINRPLLALERAVPGLGDLVYIPGGPMADSLPDLATGMAELGGLPGFVVQMEPELGVSPGEAETFAQVNGLGLRPGVQPNRSTVVVDLGPDEEAILAGFHSKTRYNVRLAERRGVTVEAVALTPQTMAEMYQLMHSSQERGGYYMRPQVYFEMAWRAYDKYHQGQLFFAKYEGQILAGAFVTYLGQKALYKDGGSTRVHRELQPMSLLQWEAMRWLKARGVERYDLHGVPPVDQLDDPNHPFAGLARFKLGFQPEVTTHIGMLEQVHKPRAYRLWRRGGERVYGSALYRVKRQSIY